MILSKGAIEQVEKGTTSHPILQVLGAKRHGKNVSLKVSDGLYSHTALLSENCNRYLETETLKTFNVIKAEVTWTTQGSKGFIVIMELNLYQQYSNLIGNPVEYEARNLNVSSPYQAQREYPSAETSSLPVRVKSDSQIRITPVRGLNPYSSKWTIQCRVTNKGHIRTWNKGPSNQGSLFSVTLLDKEDTEIKATFFRKGVDRFYTFLEVQKVYNFSNGQIKLANKKFNNTNCDYEITFNQTAEITPATNMEIKQITISPTSIQTLSPERTTIVDVCAAVLSWGEVETFTSKAGREITKLELQLVDKSSTSIRCTIFGDKCIELDSDFKRINAEFINLESPYLVDVKKVIILAIKGVKVSDYGGCTLSTLPNSEILVNPNIPEKNAIIGWLRAGVNINTISSKSHEQKGGNTTLDSSMNTRKTMHFLSSFTDSSDQKGMYIFVKGIISKIRRNMISYPACPEEGSNKKVIQQPDGSYFCETTGKSYKDCQHRYILSMEIADHTGSIWATMFNEQAETIIGHTANEVETIRATNEELFEGILLRTTFEEYLFKIRVKNEIYQNQSKLRYTLVSAQRFDFSQENQQLTEYIHNFTN